MSLTIPPRNTRKHAYVHRHTQGAGPEKTHTGTHGRKQGTQALRTTPRPPENTHTQKGHKAQYNGILRT
jgi:hypothetical protein